MTRHPHLDLHSTDVATRMMRVFMSHVARRWHLSDADMVLLFQLHPPQWQHWLAHQEMPGFNEEQVIRFSHALNLFADLVSVLGSHERAGQWMHRANSAPGMNGQSALDYLRAQHGCQSAWQTLRAQLGPSLSGAFS